MKILFLILLLTFQTFADTPPVLNIFLMRGGGQTGLVNSVSGALSPLAPGSSGQCLVSNGSAWLSAACTSSGGAIWGNITGTLSNQTDLQTVLNGKYSTSNPSGYITNTVTTLPSLSLPYSQVTGTPSPVSPGGLNLQFQYNNAGVFAGDTAVTNGSGGWSATSLALGSLTASTAIVSDSTKHLISSSTTSTELGYVSGVTSAIQTQINSKINSSFIAAPNGVASLDGSGLVPSSQIPPLAITETYVVSSQAAMLALSASIGDIAVRTDVNETFILQTTPPSTLSNWIQLLQPGAPVQSVNGQTGTVSLTTSNISEGSNLYFTTARAQASVSATAPLVDTAGVFSIPAATSSVNGYLTSANFSTFNGKQIAGNYLTTLTGDITATGPGSSAATLATVNSDVGSFTSANITVNAKGLITAASNGSGGSGITIGDPITGGFANGVLLADNSGNLAQDTNFEWYPGQGLQIGVASNAFIDTSGNITAPYVQANAIYGNYVAANNDGGLYVLAGSSINYSVTGSGAAAGDYLNNGFYNGFPSFSGNGNPYEIVLGNTGSYIISNGPNNTSGPYWLASAGPTNPFTTYAPMNGATGTLTLVGSFPFVADYLGNVKANAFVGDGSGLTGITSSISIGQPISGSADANGMLYVGTDGDLHEDNGITTSTDGDLTVEGIFNAGGGNLTVDTSGNLATNGSVTATALNGDGTNVTNVSAVEANVAVNLENITLGSGGNITYQNGGTIYYDQGITTDGIANMASVNSINLTGVQTAWYIDASGNVTAASFSGDGSNLTGSAASFSVGGAAFAEQAGAINVTYSTAGGQLLLTPDGNEVIDMGITINSSGELNYLSGINTSGGAYWQINDNGSVSFAMNTFSIDSSGNTTTNSIINATTFSSDAGAFTSNGSGLVNVAELNAANLTPNTPVIADGSNNLISGSYSGNTTELATVSGSETAGQFTKWDSSGNIVNGGLGTDSNSHIITTGTAPTITSGCGTSPSVAGNDNAGRITVGTGIGTTSCTLTFNNAWTGNAPSCHVTDESVALALQASASTTVLTITTVSTLAAASTITYYCIGFY